MALFYLVSFVVFYSSRVFRFGSYFAYVLALVPVLMMRAHRVCIVSFLWAKDANAAKIVEYSEFFYDVGSDTTPIFFRLSQSKKQSMVRKPFDGSFYRTPYVKMEIHGEDGCNSDETNSISS